MLLLTVIPPACSPPAPIAPGLRDALADVPCKPKVERLGPSNARRVVVHVLDVHVVPDDLAKAEGDDPEVVAHHARKVHSEQDEVLEALAGMGVRAVHAEGLTADGLNAWNVKLGRPRGKRGRPRDAAGRHRHGEARTAKDDLLAKLEKMEGALLEPGILARLVAKGVRLEALPLDDAEALEAAVPQVEGGKVVLPPGSKAARQEAMARLLPQASLAVIILGPGTTCTECWGRVRCTSGSRRPR